jgi:hypothetical protein
MPGSSLPPRRRGETSAVGKASGKRDVAGSYLKSDEDMARALSLVHDWKLGHRGDL